MCFLLTHLDSLGPAVSIDEKGPCSSASVDREIRQYFELPITHLLWFKATMSMLRTLAPGMMLHQLRKAKASYFRSNLIT